MTNSQMSSRQNDSASFLSFFSFVQRLVRWRNHFSRPISFVFSLICIFHFSSVTKQQIDHSPSTSGWGQKTASQGANLIVNRINHFVNNCTARLKTKALGRNRPFLDCLLPEKFVKKNPIPHCGYFSHKKQNYGRKAIFPALQFLSLKALARSNPDRREYGK